MSASHYVFKPFLFHSKQGGCEIALVSLRGCGGENEWGSAGLDELISMAFRLLTARVQPQID